MFEHIKRIKQEELAQKLQALESLSNERRQPLLDLSVRISELQYRQEAGFEKKEFGFVQKHITRRSAYKAYLDKLEEHSNLPETIAKLKEEYAEKEKAIDDSLRAEGVFDEYNETHAAFDTVKYAKSLAAMGVSVDSALAILSEHGIEPVLTEADKEVFVHPRDYSSKSSLIAVHKTNFAPSGDIIKTSKDSHAKKEKTIMINGTQYTYSFEHERDTIHMAMNDEVSSHMYGSWDNCPYAILVPFEDIPNEKIARAAPMDTFTRGNLALTENSWILCPKDQVAEIQKANPKVRVMGYEGESVAGFSQPFLSALGYRPEDVGMWSWQDSDSAKQFSELLRKEGIIEGTHSYTYFHEDEEVLTGINQAISLCSLIRDNNLISFSKDIPALTQELSNAHQHFGTILSGLAEPGLTKDAEATAIKANGLQVDIFLKKLAESGFDLSPAYQSVLRDLCKTPLGKKNENPYDFVESIPEFSDNELLNIKKLERSLNSTSFYDTETRSAAFNEFISSALCETIIKSKTLATSQDKEEDISTKETELTSDEFEDSIEMQ